MTASDVCNGRIVETAGETTLLPGRPFATYVGPVWTAGGRLWVLVANRPVPVRHDIGGRYVEAA